VAHANARSVVCETQLQLARASLRSDRRTVDANVDRLVVGHLLREWALRRRPQPVAAEQLERPAVHRVPPRIRRLGEHVRSAGRREANDARACVGGDLDAQVLRLDDFCAQTVKVAGAHTGNASDVANGRTGVYTPGVAWPAWNTSKPR
jgi:hypothetical protein